MSYTEDGYQQSATYRCSAGCGGTVTIQVEGAGVLTCCGQTMTRVE